jgi:hypothetical protein
MELYVLGWGRHGAATQKCALFCVSVPEVFRCLYFTVVMSFVVLG